MNPDTLSLDVDQKSQWVDEQLLQCLSSDSPIPNLHEALLYSLGLDIEDRIKRGKRVRPVLCLQACEALGGDPDAAMPFACAIELMHNFCLIHDDLEDGDTMRRDRAAVWVKYGEAHAINIGDYMLTKVFQILTHDARIASPQLRVGLLQLISETLDHTHIGQALDINARMKREFALENYLQIVREKTGYYLAAPIVGGAMTANADAAVVQAIRQFGQFIGPLFQVIDDLIDLTEGKGRGERGSDIREGKRSYLVAITAQAASAAERERLFDILDLPRSETTPEHVEEVIALFEKYGALQRAREYAEGLFDEAIKTLSAVPPALSDLLQTTFRRMAQRTR